MPPAPPPSSAALAFTFAAGAAEAASQKSRRSANANPQDNMADQLNAQSLSRAQAGTDLPMPAVDSTGNLNRMSQGDAARASPCRSRPVAPLSAKARYAKAGGPPCRGPARAARGRFRLAPIWPMSCGHVRESPRPGTPGRPPANLPLAGLRVIELGHYIAAPFATRRSPISAPR